jgi:hypothetical protein
LSEADDEDRKKEEEEDGELTFAEKRERSERISWKLLRGAKERMETLDPKRKPGNKPGKKLPKFEDILQAYVGGAMEEELAQKYNLTIDTVKKKIPVLELARMKFGFPKEPPPPVLPVFPKLEQCPPAVLSELLRLLQ